MTFIVFNCTSFAQKCNENRIGIAHCHYLAGSYNWILLLYDIVSWPCRTQRPQLADSCIRLVNCNCSVLCLVIEKFTENTRFCIVCNYLSKIIPALQSRCTRFRFGPLTTEQIVPRLEYVISQERCAPHLVSLLYHRLSTDSHTTKQGCMHVRVNAKAVKKI